MWNCYYQFHNSAMQGFMHQSDELIKNTNFLKLNRMTKS